MILVRRACSVVIACAFAVAGLAGCSSGHGPPPRVCCSSPDAYALDVTTAGRVRWQVALPLPIYGFGRLSPLAVGAAAVFAQGDVLYGLRTPAPALPVFPAGSLLVVSAATPRGSHLLAAFRMSDGYRAWRLTIRAPVTVPPQVVPGGMLVYSAAVPRAYGV